LKACVGEHPPAARGRRVNEATLLRTAYFFFGGPMMPLSMAFRSASMSSNMLGSFGFAAAFLPAAIAGAALMAPISRPAAANTERPWVANLCKTSPELILLDPVGRPRVRLPPERYKT